MPEPPSETKKGAAEPGSKTDNKAAAGPPATRYPFVAAAELIDVRSETAVKARTTDLSVSGCYVDTMNPFSAGTELKLRLTHHERTFEASGTVVHSQPGMGMGIAFTRVEPDQKPALERWLAELRGEKISVPEAPRPRDTTQESSLSERQILSLLISLLIKKGILTEAEGSALLRALRR
ncbi:MAG TPA: PilZ domain-containing protein [Candidatus Acidoferrales bacterium]